MRFSLRNGVVWIALLLVCAGILHAQVPTAPIGGAPVGQPAAPVAQPQPGTQPAWNPLAPIAGGSPTGEGSASNWRSSGSSPGGLQPVATAQRANIAKVTSGAGTLPNDAGQVWREYDITPYTLRVTSTARPEQAIIDWILRETGCEAWHGEPLGMLSANGRVLRCYHTPEMQAVVAEIVDRYVNSQAETQAFGVRILTVNSPNWRAKMQRVLKPVSVQSQGVQAWVLAKEDAALLVGELQKRTDFREHSSPHLIVNNGQSTVISASRPKNYVKNVIYKPEAWPGFEPEVSMLEEGYALDFKPLLSLDGRTIDAVIKCNIDQVEKLVPVMLDVPTPAAPRQRTQIDVPQLNSHRFAEKFHWPLDMVLMVSFGVVPSPTPQATGGVKVPFVTPPDHMEALVLFDHRGTAGKPPSVSRTMPVTTSMRPY